MFAFGVALTSVEMYEDFAEPGINLSAEPDTQKLIFSSAGSIFRNYNLILDKAAEIEGLEGLVLIHQDAEITQPDFLARMREAMQDEDVAIVGCAGAVDVRNIAWWEGSVTWASFTHRYGEMGGGEIPALSWLDEEIPPYAKTGEVDSVDGFVMGFTPWAIKNLRFDESIGTALHGYDFDICMQARAAGKKVVTADLKVIHHHSLELISDADSWADAHVRIARKWDDHLPEPYGEPLDWKTRALRSEAERSVAMSMGAAARLLFEARIRVLERERAEIENSLSWRVTRPLRALSGFFKRSGRSGRK